MIQTHRSKIHRRYAEAELMSAISKYREAQRWKNYIGQLVEKLNGGPWNPHEVS